MPSRVAWTPQQLALFDADQKRRRKRAVPVPERATHIAVADMLAKLARPDWWWSTIPSGELRTKETGALLRRMGVRPGIPDLLFIAPDGSTRWLELKRGRAGRLSPAQLEFQALCVARGIPHAVARSFTEAEAQLRAWGCLRPARS